jgi:HNH endonuclease
MRKDKGGKGTNTQKYRLWRAAVLKRDKNKCVRCGSIERLDAHHKIAWKDAENLRFDFSNGETLCRKCHMSHEQKLRIEKGKGTEFKKGMIPWNKGLKGYREGPRKPHTEETKIKCRLANKGKRRSEKTEFKKGMIPWNKGIKRKKDGLP